jgi:hypothetical protein
MATRESRLFVASKMLASDHGPCVNLTQPCRKTDPERIRDPYPIPLLRISARERFHPKSCEVHMRVWLRLILCSASVLLSMVFNCPLTRAQSGPVTWVVPSLERVGKTGAPGANTLAQIRAARGEWESFQIVIQAPAGGLTNVNVEISGLAGPGGYTIPRNSFSLFREHYVFVSSSSPDWRGSNRPTGPGWYPDALIPFVDPSTGQSPVGAALTAVPFNLPAGENQPIWVDLQVPRNAPAGQYFGMYTVTSNEGRFDGPVNLLVWDFTLPLAPSLKTSFLVWSAGGLATDRELLRNKVSPTLTALVDQRTLIDEFGLNTADVPFWSGADIGNCSMLPAPSVAQFQAAVAMQQPDLYLYDYSADEIGHCPGLYPRIREWARNMHQAGLRNLITMAPVAELFDDGSGTGRSAVDVWVMLPVMYDNAVALVQQALLKGDEAWSYTTLVQDAYSPKWEIDFHPMNFRIKPGYLSQSLGLTGILYWRVDRWLSDPWNNVNNAGTFSFANFPGEGMLVYPGQQVGIAGVAPSMRLKWIRDGVEDYEYVQILKRLGAQEPALQLARTVGYDWANWTRDLHALENARGQLADAIAGSSSPGPPEAPVNPSPSDGAVDVSSAPALSWSVSNGASSYDVYFGTTIDPPFVLNTSTAGFAPGNLTPGATYYWRVVANGTGGSSTSSVWSFVVAPTVNAAPVVGSVTPSAAAGNRQTFALSYADADGYSDLAAVEVLVNTELNGSNGCWVRFEQASGTLSLADDAGASWSAIAIGSAGSLQNSQCTIYAGSSAANGSAETLTLTVDIGFDRAFFGTKTIFMRAWDRSGTASDFSAQGTFRVRRFGRN